MLLEQAEQYLNIASNVISGDKVLRREFRKAGPHNHPNLSWIRKQVELQLPFEVKLTKTQTGMLSDKITEMHNSIMLPVGHAPVPSKPTGNLRNMFPTTYFATKAIQVNAQVKNLLYQNWPSNLDERRDRITKLASNERSSLTPEVRGLLRNYKPSVRTAVLGVILDSIELVCDKARTKLAQDRVVEEKAKKAVRDSISPNLTAEELRVAMPTHKMVMGHMHVPPTFSEELDRIKRKIYNHTDLFGSHSPICNTSPIPAEAAKEMHKRVSTDLSVGFPIGMIASDDASRVFKINRNEKSLEDTMMDVEKPSRTLVEVFGTVITDKPESTLLDMITVAHRKIDDLAEHAKVSKKIKARVAGIKAGIKLIVKELDKDVAVTATDVDSASK